MIILVLSNIWFQPLLKWERSWQWAWSVEKRNRQILLRWRWRWRMLTLMTLSKLRKKSWFQIGILLGNRLHSKLIVSMSGHHTSGEVTLLFPNEHFIHATVYLISRVLIVCKPHDNGWTINFDPTIQSYKFFFDPFHHHLLRIYRISKKSTRHG